MKLETRQSLDKAVESIAAARLLLENQHVEIAVTRAYYAMFYVAEGLLLEEGFESKTHTGVHSLFGQHFSKAGKLNPKFHRWMLEAFDARCQADYLLGVVIPPEEVALSIEQASEFLSAAEEFLSRPENR